MAFEAQDGARRSDGAASPLEVMRVFLKLGLTSFGGPVAHLGYFRNEFVLKRRWLGEAQFADLIALCQFLPGPASSQAGFAIGLLRAGPFGALAAWAGFTLPSALALTLFAYAQGALTGKTGAGLLHGLKLVAVAIVAQAVLGMARSLVPDKPRAAIAVLALVVTAFGQGSIAQVGAIVAGGLAGLALLEPEVQRPAEAEAEPLVSRRAGLVSLAAYFALLVIAFLPTRNAALAFLAAIYRSGALVFGGGHVVLPLLRAALVVPGYVSDGAFLAGYGAAQAVPGPLFTFAAYLGAVAKAPAGVAGAALALIAIFLPGLLVLLGALPFWHALRARPHARAAMAGVNAAVVGLLASALYDPVFTSAIRTAPDFAVAAAGFVGLVVWGARPIAVVAAIAAAGIALGFAGQ